MENRQRGRYSRQAAIDELKRRNLWGYVEPILTMGSAVIAEPVSGMAGLAALPYGSEAATRAINRTQEAMTYQPRTQEGDNALKIIGELVQPVGDAFIGASEYLGDAAYDATGSPALGAAAYSVPTMALEALGMKGASKLSKGRAYEMGDIGSQASRIGGKQRGAVGGITPQDAIKELERRGFDTSTLYYHGSPNKNISRLEVGGIGATGVNGNVFGDGINLTKDKVLASSYAGNSGRVYQTNIRGKVFDAQSEDILNPDEAAAINKILNEQFDEGSRAAILGDAGGRRKVASFATEQEVEDFYNTQLENWKYFSGMSRTEPEFGAGFTLEYTDFNAPVDVTGLKRSDFAAALQRSGGQNITKALRGAGYDGVTYHNQTIMFDPDNVRIIDVPEDELIVRRDGGVSNSVSKDAAIKELERRGIDMSKEARLQRARDMGFDTDQVYYHGTLSDDVSRFDLEKFGKNDFGWHGKGVYFSKEPEMANKYAGYQPSMIDVDAPELGYEKWSSSDDKMLGRWNEQGKMPNVLPVYVRGNVISTNRTGAAIQDFPEADALVVNYPDGYQEMIVKDPRNIRSINAAFDPNFADSAELLK